LIIIFLDKFFLAHNNNKQLKTPTYQKKKKKKKSAHTQITPKLPLLLYQVTTKKPKISFTKFYQTKVEVL
jgi:hypothetical protein